MNLDEIEAWLGQPLPDPYVSFLKMTTDSFFAANNRTLLYGRDDIVERNETYETKEYCPGNLMVGDDSGGTAFLLSLNDGYIYAVGMGSMSSDQFKLVESNFSLWANKGFPFCG